MPTRDPARRRAQSASYYRRNRARLLRKQDDWRLCHEYGLSRQAYDALLEQQGGVCAICGQINPNGYRLHVDHDHATGEVRGLLCLTCNSGIGKLHDDPALLRTAADYLERHAAPA